MRSNPTGRQLRFGAEPRKLRERVGVSAERVRAPARHHDCSDKARLLQTTDHARELLRHVVPELSPPEIEHRGSFRVKRQTVLFADAPTTPVAISHTLLLTLKEAPRG
ncbi:Scr1 family TA system antitoxin-like transcriptional regulator [Streptomyces sp. NPDC088253]|uniref:Scr1 family TA system antitoxin-like transcriptional regulator n=1 Tax=Streptomyces sp. NPDC088253 TaxID=3365846 RepID=UPI0038051CEF